LLKKRQARIDGMVFANAATIFKIIEVTI